MMEKYLITDEWKVIEEGFSAERLRKSESIFSLGNGRFGERGYFEEPYSSDSYRAGFVAGIPYLDKTRVSWWKNGFSRYYTRIPVAADWSSIRLRLIDEELDLAQWSIDAFTRTLDMKRGVSLRDMDVTSTRGYRLHIHVEHLDSMSHPDLCMIKYSVTSLNYRGRLSLLPLLVGSCEESDGVAGEEKIWNTLRSGVSRNCAYLWTQTRREDGQVCYAMTYHLYKNNHPATHNPIRIEKDNQPGFSVGVEVMPGDCVTLVKYVIIASSLYNERQDLPDNAIDQALKVRNEGWDKLLHQHEQAWQEIWNETDVEIDGDPEAQQGIRYNIFQLYQTYRGDDPRLNIAPKGFTGEKYGGNTYWNTELCCVPFFLLSTSRSIVHNLLMYRYNQLPKAIENAARLGMTGGAALFPQVTSNGEECHSEWEITFEEIHRNNIIAYAITQHALFTGSMDYVVHYGLVVMIAICRYWSQRASFSRQRRQYVILGVTGPNEYENNVDNNWYTNFSCRQCLMKTLEYLDIVEQQYPEDYQRICRKTCLQREEETARWQDIIDRLYLPEDRELGIFVQNDGYLDKVLQSTDAIPADERPINQHWSWDRILRSCYIKQGDVLLGLYLYYYFFDTDTVRRNFRFYDPMTVHESSLSPHIHAVLAARIGEVETAYQHFIHATRLDLDDYNNEGGEGLHITSMPGSWLAIVRGFADLRVQDGQPSLSPMLPQKWSRYAFKINFRGRKLQVEVGAEVRVTLLSGEPIGLQLYDNTYQLDTDGSVTVPRIR